MYLHYFIIAFVVRISNLPFFFFTFGVHFLLKMTHSNTKTIHQMLSSLCIVYQVLRSAFTHKFRNEDTLIHTICIDYLNISE